MVRRFLGHLGWQVIDTGVQDVVRLHIVVDLPLERFVDGVEEHEGLLDAGEVTREFNRTLVVSRDIGDTHELGFTGLDSSLQVSFGKNTGVLGLPVDSIDQPCAEVKVLVELADVLFGMLVVVLLVEGLGSVSRLGEVLRREDRDNDLPVVRCVLRDS